MSGPQAGGVACATCAYFDHEPATPVGICRFLPPTAAAIPTQRMGLDGKAHLEVQQVSVWANTRPTDWCAQHQSSSPLGPYGTQR